MLVGITLARTGTQSDCEQGRLLEAARLLDQSEAAYAQAGGICGHQGLDAVAKTQQIAVGAFETARVLAGAGKRRLAISGYIRGLDANPFDRGATGQLKRELTHLEAPASKRQAARRCVLSSRLTSVGLLKDGASTLSQGLATAARTTACRRALLRLRRRRVLAMTLLHRGHAQVSQEAASLARSSYARALRIDPSLDGARSGLESSLDTESIVDSIINWLAGVPSSLVGALDWLVTLAVGLLLAAVLLWNIVLKRSFEPEIVIGEFTGQDPVSGMQGADFAALLKDRLSSDFRQQPSFAFTRIVNGSKKDMEISQDIARLFEGVPQTAFLAAAVKLMSPLLRRRVIKLSGGLVPVGELGGGVTLTLDCDGADDSDSITLWEDKFDQRPEGEGAAHWLRLVAPAAVWARWRLKPLASQQPPLDADAWLPDALFQAGTVWQLKGDLPRAASLYAEALEHKPSLLPAANNLAIIEMRNGQHRLAIKRLNDLLASLKRARREASEGAGDDPDETWPTLEVSTLYYLAMAQAYEAENGDGPNDFDAPKKTALKLVSMIEGQLAKNALALAGEEQLQRRYSRPSTVRRELESVEAPSLVMLAGIRVRSSDVEATEAAQHAERGLGRQMAPGIENAIAGAGLKDEERLAEIPAQQLIDRVLMESSLSRRAHYNLTCYYTLLAERVPDHLDACLDRALEHVEIAFEDVSLIELSKTDPSLALLKSKRPRALPKARERHSLPPVPRRP